MFGVRNCRSTLEVQALARDIAQMLDDEAGAEAEPKPEDQSEQAAPPGEGSSPLRQALDAAAEDHVSGIGELAQAAINAKGREAPALNLPMPCGATSGVALPWRREPRFQQKFRQPPMRCGNGLPGCCRRKLVSTLSGREWHAHRHAAPLPHRAGDARIFVREVTGLKTDTAVQILVDRSGP